MPEFDIDQLKKTWLDQNVRPAYGSTEIEAMLHKSSRNYVKYILTISIVEFVIILGVNLYYLFVGKDSFSILTSLERMGLKNTAALQQRFDDIYLGLKIGSLLLAAYFVLQFYRNYSQIRVEEQLKKLILQIIKFKRTVNLFILANIALMVLFMLVLGGILLKVMGEQNIEADHPTMIGLYAGFAFTLIFSVVLIWIYYRVVYGILLKRLGKNLRELEKIEQLQN